ncbi:MAG: nuclear transport factor 2 family protein [Chitinophagaceae bacterium]|nr:nuclear transport factor 2 family protein [Chitinophagaceae bacterium]
MKRLVFLLFLFFTFRQTINAQSDEKIILQILDDQTKFWNEGNLDKFVRGYWRNDSLMFIGQSGITYGYQNTLNNYKKNYSDTAKMGKLAFEIIKVQMLSSEYYFVVGKWFLKRSVGDLKGHYTLLFRKINNEWVIVADHSS